MKGVLALPIGVLITIACTAPATPPNTPQAQSAHTIRLVLPAEPERLNALVQRQTVKQVIDSNVFEPLMDLDKTGQPIPRLALSWESLDSGKTWRVHLRQGVKFHNGDAFTARDVVETGKWLLAEKARSTIYPNIPVVDVAQVDDFTADLRFEKAQPLFPIQQVQLVIYPASVATDPAKREQAVQFPVGTGPYKLVSWDLGKEIRLARFDGYWGNKPQIADAVVTWRSEAGVRLAALRAGEADWVANIAAEESKTAPKTVVLTAPDRYAVRFDAAVQRNPILADKRLRLAIDYSMNRQAFLELFSGQAVLLDGQLPLPGEFGYNASLKARPYDLEQAKVLVTQANAVGKTLTIVCTSGKRVKDRELCEAIASMVEKTGLKVKILIVASGEDTNYILTQGPNRGQKVSDMILVGPDFLFQSESRFAVGFAKNAAQVAFEDQAAWDLFDQEQVETNLAARAEKLGKSWAYLYEQAYYSPILVPAAIYGLAANLTWTPNTAGWPQLASMTFKD